MRKIIKSSNSGGIDIGEFSQYFNVLTSAEDVARNYGGDADDFYQIGEEIPGYEITVAGYAIARDEYSEMLSNNALDFAYITTDGELVYTVGDNIGGKYVDRVYNLDIEEIGEAVSTD